MLWDTTQTLKQNIFRVKEHVESETNETPNSYLDTQVVVKTARLCPGVHFDPRRRKSKASTTNRASSTLNGSPKFEGCESSLWQQQVQHHVSPLVNPSGCCSVGSWSRLNSRAWERQSAGFPGSRPPFLLHSFPRPASLWINARRCNCRLSQNTVAAAKPAPPHLHRCSEPQNLQTDSLWHPLLTLYNPYLHRQLSSAPPATMVPFCPRSTNGLGFQLILLLCRRKKKGRHQHRTGGSGHNGIPLKCFPILWTTGTRTHVEWPPATEDLIELKPSLMTGFSISASNTRSPCSWGGQKKLTVCVKIKICV